MAAPAINSKPHVLVSEDRAQHGPDEHRDRASRQRPASDAGISSGLDAGKPALARSHRHAPPTLSSSPSPSSFPTAPAPAPVSSSIAPPCTAPLSTPASASLRTAHPASFLASRPAHGHYRNGSTAPAATIAGSTASANGALASPLPPAASSSLLFFGPSNNTTPETSLVSTRGKSIPLDDAVTAHRTSALRQLNTSFPSPVFRHQSKSAGAQSTTFSQPVIVRTYPGPSQSRSTSSHYRPPSSSSRRPASRASGSRRIPFVPSPNLAASSSAAAGDVAASSRNNAQSVGWSIAHTLFGMARSKGKQGSFLPWPFVGGDASQDDEAKLPPLEAFSYKGFMADLQTTTDIRSDLDRIAEICARSRYCLSDKYDSHVTPHGSGASFAASVRQHPSWSKGRRRGSSSPGGPTLQAVPSDDDESNGRGSRHRRGGIGGGRRRSAAYGTLETIMSSSRSSEEDKAKKKSAADITEAVRGRAARKGMVGPETTEPADEEAGRHDPASGSSQSPHGQDKSKRGSPPAEDSSSPDHVDDSSAIPATRGGPRTSRTSPERKHGRPSRRPKSAAFAHAMMGSSRSQQRQRQAAAASAAMEFPSTTEPALLSDPALPQTTDGSLDLYSALDAINTPTAPRTHHTRSRRGRREPGIHIVDPDSEGLHDPVLLLDVDDDGAADATGFFMGLTHWIPWMAADPNNAVAAEQPWAGGRGRARSHETSLPSAAEAPATAGPSHAEGSLRELLKTVDDVGGKQNKGKAVSDRRKP